MCREFCVVPPGFLAEDRIIQRAFSRCQDYLTERFIRLPLREADWESYFEKKEREYAQHRDLYPGLFDPGSQELLRKYSIATTTRSSRVAEEIIHQWEEGPDINGIWKNLISLTDPGQIERIRKIPRAIYERGTAVTWPAIRKDIGTGIGVHLDIWRYALQHHYFNTYIKEFDLRIITRLQFARTDFSLGTGDLRYDYEALKGALSALQIWDMVRVMPAKSMIALRTTKHGYFKFRHAFDYIAGQCQFASDVNQAFAWGAKEASSTFKETSILNKYRIASGLFLPYQLSFDDEEIEAISQRMEVASPFAEEALAEAHQKRTKTRSGSRMAAREVRKMIAIFVALEMEREILVNELGLTSSYPELIFKGKIGSAPVVVFSPQDMGRVPAAVRTMSFLSDNRPELIIVAGIAGGFGKQGIELGDVIIATSCVDLATRKIRIEEGGITIPEFRPKENPTDRRIEDYVNYKLNKAEWEMLVIRNAEWPKGRRPTIHCGPIASLDEVVSSDDWVDNLLLAWPTLVGVEMEAGGVCAAASCFNVPVAVIRGISDLANPAKSDDQWRRLAMKTIVHLFRQIEWNDILISSRSEEE